MFTGIIEEIGVIDSIRPIPQGREMAIHAETVLEDLSVDQSIAVNGVCLTVTNISPKNFTAVAVQETLNRSTLGKVYAKTEVNLERALQLDHRLGGHLVQGHVDALAVVKKIQKQGAAHILEIRIPTELQKYIIEKGSIAIDGISLTVAELKSGSIALSIIPHTWENTTLKNLTTGFYVNVETDMIAKYVERLVNQKNQSSLTEDQLRSLGF